MATIGPRAPFSSSPETFHDQIREWPVELKQNLINVLLTVPGERIMMATFGVGLRKFLFELDNASTRNAIKDKIMEQVELYVPQIEIVDIIVDSPADNHVKIYFEYYIPALGTQDVLIIDADGNELSIS